MCCTGCHKEEEEGRPARKCETHIEYIYEESSARIWRLGEQITVETENGKPMKG
jgi:hypothetical protein